MELKTFSDSELDSTRIAVATEIERRANMAAIPSQIEKLAKLYRDGGGDEQALADALTPEQIAELNRA